MGLEFKFKNLLEFYFFLNIGLLICLILLFKFGILFDIMMFKYWKVVLERDVM